MLGIGSGSKSSTSNCWDLIECLLRTVGSKYSKIQNYIPNFRPAALVGRLHELGNASAVERKGGSAGKLGRARVGLLGDYQDAPKHEVKCRSTQ